MTFTSVIWCIIGVALYLCVLYAWMYSCDRLFNLSDTSKMTWSGDIDPIPVLFCAFGCVIISIIFISIVGYFDYVNKDDCELLQIACIHKYISYIINFLKNK